MHLNGAYFNTDLESRARCAVRGGIEQVLGQRFGGASRPNGELFQRRERFLALAERAEQLGEQIADYLRVKPSAFDRVVNLIEGFSATKAFYFLDRISFATFECHQKARCSGHTHFPDKRLPTLADQRGIDFRRDFRHRILKR